MAEYSAKDIAALRKATGAGMMDCKQALEESDGDLERAPWTGCAPRASRKAGKLQRPRGHRGRGRRRWSTATSASIVELNCNTDFVAKGADFTGSSPSITKLVAGERRRRRRRAAVRGVDGRRDAQQLAGKLGENVMLGRVVRFESDGLLDALPAQPERPRHHRRAGRDQRRRPVERARPGRSRTRSRCTSRSRRPATSPATRCPPTCSPASRRSSRRRAATRACPRPSSRARCKGRLNALLQGRRAARAALGEGPEGHDRQAGRGPRRRRQAARGSPASRWARTSVRPHERRSDRWSRASIRRVVLKLSGEAFADTDHRLRHRRRGRAAHRRGDGRGARASSASRSRSSSAAATSGGACPARRVAWTAPAPTTWACSPP